MAQAKKIKLRALIFCPLIWNLQAPLSFGIVTSDVWDCGCSVSLIPSVTIKSWSVTKNVEYPVKFDFQIKIITKLV